MGEDAVQGVGEDAVKPQICNTVWGKAGTVNGDGGWNTKNDEDDFRGEWHQHQSHECQRYVSCFINYEDFHTEKKAFRTSLNSTVNSTLGEYRPG